MANKVIENGPNFYHFSSCHGTLRHNLFKLLCSTNSINVTEGMFCMNGTTSVPKSVLRYSVDKVRQESESEV